MSIKQREIIISDEKKVRKYNFKYLRGIILGMDSSTFMNPDKFPLIQEDACNTWECLSIVLKLRTIDIFCEERPSLICIW